MRSNPISLTGLARLTGVALLAAACGSGPSAATRPSTVPAVDGRATGTPIPTVVAPASTATATTAASTLPPASPDAWLAVGRRGVPGLEVILASTREVVFDLPTGVPDSQWSRLVVAEIQPPAQQLLPRLEGLATLVRDLAVQPGFGGPSTRIEGAWHLPTIGPDPVPVGVSGDGSTIVLAESVAPGTDGRTRFVVLRGGLAGPARTIDLAGRFEYDALSPNGAVLYVIEHLDEVVGGRYQVRAVDLATGTLRDGAIVDKTRLDETMVGYPLGQIRRADGGVLTLYRGSRNPFIHGLNSAEGWATCIDLPAAGSGDPAAAADWGLAQTPDGRAAFAVNATLGQIVEVDPVTFELRRSTRVKPLAGSGIVLAKFGHQPSGPVGRRVVVGPDGGTIYAAGAGGILAIDAATLKISRTIDAGKPVDALAVTPDGGTLYALLHDGGRVVKLDAVSGELLATVPGQGYDRLVAVVPW